MRRLVLLALCVLPLLLVALNAGIRPVGAAGPPTPTSPAPLFAVTAHQSASLSSPLAGTDTTSFPDCTIACSSTTIVTAANSELRIADLNGTTQAQGTLASLFGLANTVVIYSPHLLFANNQFVLAATQLDRGGTASKLLLAASTTSSPANLTAGNWRTATIDSNAATPTSFGEVAGIGYDATNVYVTLDQYDYVQNPGTFVTSRLAFATWASISTGPITIQPIQPIPDLPAGAFPGGYGVAGVHPFHPQPIQGDGDSFLLCAGNEFSGTANNGFTIYPITPGTGVVGAGIFTPVTTWTPVPRTGFPNTPVQDNFKPLRLFDFVEKVVKKGGKYYTTQTVQSSTPFRSAVRMYRFTGGGVQDFASNIEDSVRDFYFGAIAPDQRGNATIVFQSSNSGVISGTAEAPSIYHTRFVSAVGGYFEIPRQALASTFTFNVGLNQPSGPAPNQGAPANPVPWGRYTDAALDVQTANGDYVYTHAELTLATNQWRTIVHKVPTRYMQVLQPNGGEDFYVIGTTQPIYWAAGSANPGQTVRIQIVSPDWNNGVPTTLPGAATLPDTGSYSWNPVTAPATIHARVRISINGTGFTDDSDADFQIINPNQDSATTFPVAPPYPLAIPDNWQSEADWVDSPLFLTKDLIIQTIRVTVDITHPYENDLQVLLVHPDGTSVALHNQSGVPPLNKPGPFGGARTYPVPTAPDEGTQNMLNKLLLKPSRLWDGQGKEIPWRLRVRDLNPTSVGQLNGWSITVNGQERTRLKVTRANGGERFRIGQPEKLTWTNDPNNPIQGNVQVTIDRNGDFTNNPPGDQTILPAVPVDTLEEAWDPVVGPASPAGAIGSQLTLPLTAKVRVKSLADPQQFDDSDAPFAILDDQLQVLTPNAAGLTFFTGQNIPITWDSLPMTGNVHIEITKNASAMSPTWSDVVASTPNDGSFDWTVLPGFDTTDGKIRITSVETPSLTDISNNPFNIVTKAITVTGPVGNPAGTVFVDENDANSRISWTSAGITGPVKIELSRNSSDANPTWETVIASVNVGSSPQNWTVTAPATTDAKIRITSLDDPTVSGVSANPFTIKQPTVTVIDPAAGDPESGPVKWAISKSYKINWTSANVPPGVTNVIIEVRRGLGQWEFIANTANTGTYTWASVTGPANPANISSNIRITLVNFPSSAGISAPFKIVTPAVKVTQPNGGEGLGINRTYTIRWDATPPDSALNPSNVKIELSRDNGGSWTPIFASTPNDGQEDWVATGPPTAQALIRVTVIGAVFPSETDVSDNVFRIDTQGITVTEPHAMEKLFVGTTKTITWTAVGVDGLVDIEVHRGMAVQTIATGLPVGSGAVGFDWDVTGPANGAVVRVVSETDSGVFGDSNPFDIVNFGLVITAPSGSPTWGIGTSRKIKWTFNSGYTGSADVYVRHAGEMVDTLIGSGSGANGSLDWGVNGPAGAATITVKVPNTAPGPDTQATATVNIAQPGITVTAPSNGQELRVGQQATLTWTSVGLQQEDLSNGHVNIFLSRNGGNFQPIPGLQNIVNSGSAQWTPIAGQDTNNAKIRVTSVELPSATDDSDQFTIVTPSLVITKPQPGDQLVVGDNTSINWTAVGVTGPLLIELTRNGGGSWETIQSGVAANAGTIPWQVTGNSSSSNCKIRITSQAVIDNAIQANMLGTFTITKPSITVGTPNGGQNYLAGSTQTVTWGSQGVPASENVKIELLKGGVVVQTLSAATPNDGSEQWTVPNTAGNDYKIRITRSGSPAATDDSNSNFSVVSRTGNAGLQVTHPNNGSFKRNKQLNITWTGNIVSALGGGGSVDIYLSTDGGTTFTKIIANTANDGQVNWVITAKATKKAKIKIVWLQDPSVNATSGQFQIKK